MDSKNRTKRSNLAVGLGLTANILLSVLKTSIGIIGHSPALLADGINSTSDVAYYLFVSIFMRASHKPADDEHPYGHSQFESVGALVVGAFVITTSFAIFWTSLDTLFDLLNGQDSFQGGLSITLWTAIFTVVLKILLTLLTRKIGKETKNSSVIALAMDHQNDILAASAAAIGILFGRLGYLWMDPLAGALVAVFILRTGISIMRDATSDLMDTVPGKALQEQVKLILEPIAEVKEIGKIQAHRFGQYLTINLTISVDGNLSVYEGDRIASQVETLLLKDIDYLMDVHVHFHP